MRFVGRRFVVRHRLVEGVSTSAWALGIVCANDEQARVVSPPPLE